MNLRINFFLRCMYCLLLSAGGAHAHGLPIGGLVPFVENGEVIGAGTTWGIVLQEDGKWLRSCEEGTGAMARFYHRLPDGRVLVASDEGLFVTSDGGCTYESVAESLSAQSIGALQAARDVPERIFVATRTPGQENGVFRSLDGGLTFTATELKRSGVLFDGIIATGDGETLLVHALDFTSLENLVFVSRDAGETFVQTPPALADFEYVRLLGTSANGDKLIVSALPAAGGNVVLESADGFVTANEIVRVDYEVTAFARVGDAELLSSSGTRLLRRMTPDAAFEQVLGPTRCLTRVNGSESLFACGALPDNAHILSTADGVNWETYIPFLGVEERLCPTGTPGFERCVQFIFPPDEEPDAPRTNPPPKSGAEASCKCIQGAADSSHTGYLAALLLACPWFWRKRHNARSTV